MPFRQVNASEVPGGGGSFPWQQYANPETADGWIAEAVRRASWVDTGSWDAQQRAVIATWEALGNVHRALNIQPFVNPHYANPFEAAYSENNDAPGVFRTQGLAFANMAFGVSNTLAGIARQRIVLARDGTTATACFQRFLLDQQGNADATKLGPFWSDYCASGYQAIGTLDGQGCGREDSIPGGVYNWRCWGATNDFWYLPSGSACMDLAREIAGRMQARGALGVLDDSRVYAVAQNLRTYHDYVHADTQPDQVSAQQIAAAAAQLIANDPVRANFNTTKAAALGALATLGSVGVAAAHIAPPVGAVLVLGSAVAAAIIGVLPPLPQLVMVDAFGRKLPLFETVTIAVGNTMPDYVVPPPPAPPNAGTAIRAAKNPVGRISIASGGNNPSFQDLVSTLAAPAAAANAGTIAPAADTTTTLGGVWKWVQANPYKAGTLAVATAGVVVGALALLKRNS